MLGGHHRNRVVGAGGGGGLPQPGFLVINCAVDEGAGVALSNTGLWADGTIYQHSWGTSANIGASLTPTASAACRTNVLLAATAIYPLSGALTVDLDGTDRGAFFIIGSYSTFDSAAQNSIVLGVGGTNMINNTGNNIQGITEGVALESIGIAIGTGKRRVGFTMGADKVMRLYVDGAFAGSHTYNAAADPNIGDCIKFGGYFDNNRNLTAPFNKVRYWNGAKLSDAEMLEESQI